MTRDQTSAAGGRNRVEAAGSMECDPTAPASKPHGPTPRLEPIGGRLARWASNLLVSGLILIVGLVFGREVIQWWRVDGGPLPNGAAAASARSGVASGELAPSSATEQLLSFGDFPHTLSRSELVGDLPDVLSHLRHACREVLAGREPVDAEPGPAERRMLAGTAELTPVDSLPGKWSIYELQAPLPMVVGIRESLAKAIDAQRRVVSWGLAFPSIVEPSEGPVSWTLFTYATEPAEAPTPGKFSLPAPVFGRRTLSLRTGVTGAMIGFRGQGSARDWMGFYDTWFEANGWRAAADWQSDTAPTWRRRFEHDTVGTIDFVLSSNASGFIQAVALHTPRAT